jgi:hypothetical protein
MDELRQHYSEKFCKVNDTDKFLIFNVEIDNYVTRPTSLVGLPTEVSFNKHRIIDMLVELEQKNKIQHIVVWRHEIARDMKIGGVVYPFLIGVEDRFSNQNTQINNP